MSTNTTTPYFLFQDFKEKMEHTSIISIPHDAPQAFRCVYRNQSPGFTISQNITYLIPQFDPECGLHVIFWEEILKTFENAITFRRGRCPAQFIKDMDMRILYPLRLHISTGVILDIIIENPIGIPGSSQHQNSLGINLGSTRSISRYPFLDPRTNNESAFQDLLLDLDTTSGIGLTLKKAINGDTQSQTDMGEIYSAFHLNYIRAKEWFLKAANQGHPIAQHSIGTFYLKGDGVPRSYKTANEWFLKAAEKEYPPSLTAIGILHHEGRVYSRDSNKAMEWFLRAEQHECASAPRNIAIMYNYGHGVAQDYSKALEWYSKAAERGNTFAQGEIGCLHRIGKGVPKSRSHTIKWYLLSAHQGNQRAQVLLGNLYYPRDPGLLKWHKIAAKQGVLSMQCSVAYSYYDGECVPLDYPLAATWFQLAVSRGDIQARNVLAEIYESGRGVPENLWMAKELYVKASRQLGSRDKLLQVTRKEKKKATNWS